MVQTGTGMRMGAGRRSIPQRMVGQNTIRCTIGTDKDTGEKQNHGACNIRRFHCGAGRQRHSIALGQTHFYSGYGGADRLHGLILGDTSVKYPGKDSKQRHEKAYAETAPIGTGGMSSWRTISQSVRSCLFHQRDRKSFVNTIASG